MDYLQAFLLGGLLCVLAQLVVDVGRLTPAHTMVLFVVSGAVLSGFGLYEPLVRWGGAGATVPLTGFGHALTQGVIREISQEGFVGVLTGGLRATALGITVAILSGYVIALAFNPKG